MRTKVTPTQQLAGVAATLAVCFANTAIVWNWPDLSMWALGGVLILVAVFWFFVYRAVRKEHPPG